MKARALELVPRDQRARKALDRLAIR